MPRCPEMYMYTFVRFFVIFSTSTCLFFCGKCRLVNDFCLLKLWCFTNKNGRYKSKVMRVDLKNMKHGWKNHEWLNIWMWPCRLFSQSFGIFEKVLVHGSNPAVFTPQTDSVAFKRQHSKGKYNSNWYISGNTVDASDILYVRAGVGYTAIPFRSYIYINILTGAGFLNHQHCVDPSEERDFEMFEQKLTQVILKLHNSLGISKNLGFPFLWL